MWHNRFFAMSGFIAVFLGIFNGDFPSFANILHLNKTINSHIVQPVAQCDDLQSVILNSNGQKSLVAVQLDNGSFDPAGGFLWFKARRVSPGPCGSDTLFRSQLNFCCADVGDTIEVVLRVYNVPVDTGGVNPQFGLANAADCVTRVYVSESVKPEIATLPNDTISCELFLSGIFFPPAATDNCCLDTILKFDQYITYDTSCKRGMVRRRFTAVDCAGNTASSTQMLTVANEQFYIVQFPADAIITGCADYSPQALGTPVIYENSCEKMNLTYIDTFQYSNQFSGFPCLTITRTWKVFNWCHYSASLPLFQVPNPNPNSYPLSPANLPGPTVGPQGIGSVSLVNFFDTIPTDYSTFWQQNANGYTYTQVIKIYDQELPGGRITSPLSYCDLTINDPTLWQGGNWVNPANNGNDLPECPALLSLKATDNCTFNDMAVHYELYLDLNNDNSWETLVASQNLPPSGSVNYGNLIPGGGEQRQFDKRIVGINQKYNFALERVTTGDSMLVRVRWNTTAAPTTYTTPQFPYGHHKLVWYVIDKCGNQTVFTHLFTTSDDCEPPVVTCVPDITVEIPSSGDSVFISTAGLVYNVSDNVTPSSDIQLSIEKEPFGIHFPQNGVGNPVFGAFFGCADLGFQPVRIWAQDEFGNTSWCQSIVAVDDPESVCTVFSPAISGSAFTMSEEPMAVDFDLFEMPDSVFVGTSNSGDLGFYYFNDLTPLHNYFVRAHVDSSDLLNGVNTYDLILISRHILNLEPLNSPYKLIAADINRSGTVTTFDIVTGRRAILGSVTAFPGNTSWRMVPQNLMFPDPQNPFQNAIPEQMNFSSVFEVIQDADFYAVKVGDVDWNAIPNELQATEDRDPATGMVLRLGDPVIHDAVAEVPVYASARESVEGFQFDLSGPDNQGVAVGFASKIIPGDHYTVAGNHLRMSWEFPLRKGTELELGRLKISPFTPEWLDNLTVNSDRYFRSAAYSGRGDNLGVEIKQRDGNTGIAASGGLQVVVNPFREEMHIVFNGEATGSGVLQITDMQGRVLVSTVVDAENSGYTLRQDTGNWAPGMYCCRLETVNGIYFAKGVRW